MGLALSLPADTDDPDPRGELDPEADPGLLYAGQWRDAESGLCYNRFRYYEPESGMYLVVIHWGCREGADLPVCAESFKMDRSLRIK